MPYRFLEDIATADVAFEACGGTLEELFVSAADALLCTMTAAPQAVARLQELLVSLEEREPDLLLFSFLQELIFYKDARRILLHADRLQIQKDGEDFSLVATCIGEEIDPARHCLLVDVKAVTMHGFKLEFMDGFWRTVVVLDV